MATFSAYAPYSVREDTALHHQTIRDPHHHEQDFFMSAIDPTLRSSSNEYSYTQQDMPGYGHNAFHFMHSPTNLLQMAPSMNTNHYLPHEQSNYTHVYENPRHSPYSPTMDPSGGNLSDMSSEYGWTSDVSQMVPSYSSSQAESFKFAPLPSDSQSSQHSGWSVDSSFMPPLTPMSEIEPRMQSIAMKELEFDSPQDASFDQKTLEDKMNSVQIQFSLQLTPEELDLSESFAELPPLYRTTTMSTQAVELSEEDCISPGHSPRGDPELGQLYKSTLSSQLSPRQSHSSSHGRSNSTASARSARGLVPGHPILDSQSRVRKGRSSKGPSPIQATNKERSRAKGSNSRLVAVENARGEKQAKFFPCAFHLFGCTTTFGNKNEWKRHVSSQHLKLFFYRCDMGNCNPENNPKLYVPSEKRHSTPIKREMEEHDDEESDIIFNDFNRKDLFTQHCRRMHGPHRYDIDNTTSTNQRINARLQRQQIQGGSTKSKTKSVVTKEDEATFEIELEDIRSRCRTLRRKAPARTSCGFCSMVFQVEPAHEMCGRVNNVNDEGKAEEKVWEERMEHIGRHYERDGCLPHQEGIDDDLVEWGISAGVLEYVIDGAGVQKPWLVGCEARSLPIHGDRDEVDGMKITGLRHKSEQKRAGLRSKQDFPRSQVYNMTMSGSEDDASAEDE